VEKKIDQLRAMMDAGDWPAAIKFAARFPRLGEHEKPIRQASSAMLSPGMYRGMGKDPDALIEAGKRALIDRYPRRA
jgi:hypothetical protein